MGKDDGAIPGESESTDGLIEQYRRCVSVASDRATQPVLRPMHIPKHIAHGSSWHRINEAGALGPLNMPVARGVGVTIRLPTSHLGLEPTLELHCLSSCSAEVTVR